MKSVKFGIVENKTVVLEYGFCPAGHNINITFDRHATMPKHIIGDIETAGANTLFRHPPDLGVVTLIRVVITDIKQPFGLRKYLLGDANTEINFVQ